MSASDSANVAAVLYAPNDLRVEDYEMPKPGKGEVLLSIRKVGICGSDVEYWKHGRIGPFVLNAPMVIGHESAGVVTAVGEGVKDLDVGDRVAIEPGVPCRACSQCRRGTYNLCPDMQFFATPPVHGSLAKFVVHPADYCYKLPDSVSLEEGAMCEPLSVGVHACRRAGVTAGHKVLVLGAGPIGLVTLLVARAMGAGAVVLTDVREERLEVARKLGATHTVHAAGKAPAEVAAAAAALVGGRFDVSIDCCGLEATTKAGLEGTVSGGRVCLVGMAQATMTLPILEASVREVDCIGIFRYRDTYPTCISLLETGLVDVKPLITHRLGFSQAEVLDGFAIARDGRDGAIKVMFSVGDEA